MRGVAGRLFRNRNRPRVCLDLKVGNSHLVEVILHLRRTDWEWYQSNHDEIEKELLNLVEESVLPRMFGDEIEAHHRKYNPQIFPPQEVGAKNKNSKSNSKRSRKGPATSTAISKPIENPSMDEKKPKDIYFAFGRTLQLAYRKQDLQVWNQFGSSLVFFKDTAVVDNNNNKKEDAEFHSLPKLSARLLIWCSKIDQQNITNPDLDNVGFFRQEMIPISALFREPKEVE